jgi:hypothetical protein
MTKTIKYMARLGPGGKPICIATKYNNGRVRIGSGMELDFRTPAKSNKRTKKKKAKKAKKASS